MLSANAIRDILKQVQFPGEDTYFLALSGKQKRKELVLLGNHESSKIAGAIEIQRVWRGYRTRKRLRIILDPLFRKLKDQQRAASIVQRSWRRFSNRKVFKFYRDLISFRSRGDPSLMLRCINPAEAKLLDKTSGAHVKFRLGGESFPPNVYYKVFTCQSVVDICAYSPRDYTAMAIKCRLAREVHNNHPRACLDDDRDGWYKRWENNGWRLVSERLFQLSTQDSVAMETAAKLKHFSYSKLQRYKDVERRKKQRKIDWMKKMYKEGMLRAKEDIDESTSLAVRKAADHLSEVTEAHGFDVVEEEDVDELIRWTNGLNFEEYMLEWHHLASTTLSAKTSTATDELTS